ncbi:MAG TPA: DUF58 domain-containing protein [Capsulimonadaceae bacterium]|jgi:uncharacterized protein (DUF58 family)
MPQTAKHSRKRNVPITGNEPASLEALEQVAFGVFARNSILRGLSHMYLERLTSAGRWLIYPTFLFGLVGSFTLEHQVHVACLFTLALWFIALLWKVFSTPRVTLDAHYPERVGAGGVMTVDVTITNRRVASAYDVRVIPHRWPSALEVVDGGSPTIPVLAKGKPTTTRLTVECHQRGVYHLAGFRPSTDFPFGVFNAACVVPAPHPLLVYPEFTPLTRMDIQTGTKYQPGGVALASKLGESFEFIGNREYREGDNIRDLDWNATARLGRPIVREYRQEYFHRVAVVLDTHVPKREQAVQSDAFERAVSLTAAIGDYMARQEYLVDIFAAGPDLYHLTAGRSLAYLDQILDILACIDESPVEPFETLEPAILEYLAQITTVICVFLDWNPSRQEFARRMAANGAAVKVVIARDLPLTMDPHADGSLGYVPVIDAEAFAAGVRTL